MLKNLVKIVLTILIVFGVVFAFNVVYKNKDQIFSLKTLEVLREKITGKPVEKGCNKIIEYSIGSIDNNFGLSNEQFLRAIKDAESVWEKGAGKELFNYSSKGELKINLVFDERQKDTTRMKEILGGINSEEGKLKAIKEEYNRLIAEAKLKEGELNADFAKYQESQSQFKELAATYDAKVAYYEKQVNFWSEKGGAPKKEYEQLTQEKAEIDDLFAQLNSQQENLKSTLSALESRRTEFNSLVSQINTIAGMFNRFAKELNVEVAAYNEVQGSRDEFISGLYTSNAKGETIDIFQFYDNRDLVTTLAHELGHALGLGHATGTTAIMYPRAEGQKTQLKKEDLLMLQALCN